MCLRVPQKFELSAIIVNIKIEPPGLGEFKCISGGKKLEGFIIFLLA